MPRCRERHHTLWLTQKPRADERVFMARHVCGWFGDPRLALAPYYILCGRLARTRRRFMLISKGESGHRSSLEHVVAEQLCGIKCSFRACSWSYRRSSRARFTCERAIIAVMIPTTGVMTHKNTFAMSFTRLPSIITIISQMTVVASVIIIGPQFATYFCLNSEEVSAKRL